MMKTVLRSRHPVIVTVGFAIFIVAVWGTLWSLAAVQYTATIDTWIKSGRDAGYQISYDNRSRFGFPFHIVLRFSNLRWRNTDGIDFSTPTIDIGALPWNWHNFSAKFKGHAQLNAPLDKENHYLSLAGESGIAQVRLSDDGVWIYSRVDMDNAALGRSPDFIMMAEKLTTWADRAEIPPKNHKDTGLTVSGEASKITLPAGMPSPFGPKMEKLDLDIRVMGPMPDFRQYNSVFTWNQNGGIVEFDKLNMEWGPLQLTAKGTMGFDDDLQPEGAFASTVGNLKPVLKALMNAGFLAERQQSMLDGAMELFAKPSHADGIDGVAVPITVQLGGVFLGPVKVMSFPNIVWPGQIETGPNTPSALTAPLPNTTLGTSVPVGTTAPADATAPSVP